MDLQFSDTSSLDASVDLLAVGLSGDLAAALATLEAKLPGLESLAADRELKTGAGTTLVVPTLGRLGARDLLLVGLGDGSPTALTAAAGAVGRKARALRARSVAIDFGRLDAAGSALVAEMVLAGNYVYDRYRRETARKPELSAVTIHGAVGADSAAVAVRAKWQKLARDLVNAPAADIYPESLAAVASEAASIDGVEVEVWDFDKCRAEGLVGIVAVGQGSTRPGVLVHMRYRPANAVDHIALVGKGVTFDSGGLSLKPSNAMQTMRCDMGGAATAIGAFGAIAELGLPVAVDCFIPSVENMCAANSYKLGDILRYNNGTTVEIHNTDAEGRLVLADGLILASAVEGVSTIIDMATLTGAIVVAIGADYTGMFTHDDGLASELSVAATNDGERVWRMPLHKPYNRMLKGTWGEIKNVGGREAGSVTAALFLEHFVRKDARWAHLDIAGTAFLDKAEGPFVAGGTGQIVRTLTTWAASLG